MGDGGRYWNQMKVFPLTQFILLLKKLRVHNLKLFYVLNSCKDFSKVQISIGEKANL